MKLYIELFFTALASLGFALFIVPAVSKIAIKADLVDKPNHRKVHTTPTPLSGGISIAITTLLSLIAGMSFLTVFREHFQLIIGGFVLLIIGIIDDKIEVKAIYKLLIELFIAYTIAANGIRITSLHGIMGIELIPVYWQYILTIFVITGVINSFNLMDGIDGLAGGLSLASIAILIPMAVMAGMNNLAFLLVGMSGAIIGFLKFNFSKKVFMGDAGSLFIGFILVVSGISILNTIEAMNTFSTNIFFLLIAGLFLVPVLDSLRVYRERIKKGGSPFKADRRHIHHLFLLMELTHKKATLLIIAVSVLLLAVLTGLGYLFPVTAAIFATVALFITIAKVLNLNKNLNFWKQKIKSMEN